MVKLLFYILIGLGLVLTCRATTYTVGGSSGWDISSDLDSWGSSNSFKAGDALLFQYSSIHSVDEVTKEDFNGCNVTNPLSSSNSGNTTIALSAPGERYFTCGNGLHCLGGMKVKVNVQGGPANSPTSAPLSPGTPSSLPNPSNKNNNPVSKGFIHGGWASLLACVAVSISLFIFGASVVGASEPAVGPRAPTGGDDIGAVVGASGAGGVGGLIEGPGDIVGVTVVDKVGGLVVGDDGESGDDLGGVMASGGGLELLVAGGGVDGDFEGEFGGGVPALGGVDELGAVALVGGAASLVGGGAVELALGDAVGADEGD
ncbi:hypothetical protein IFM89_006691 [Coptis chinensis]|uniref:Phytocyanin domain-containing protein n=1 Tax=Coptis chinensis TaxID=261450 RepID=A0A835MEC4_9MAGN|nr:hypothetical protein IFM89_006691 [Coptis chinensis]